MKTIKLLSIAAIAIAISACTSSNNGKSVTEDSHDSTTCTEHAHHTECHNHNHEMVVVGVAQQGDYSSGKITIATIPGGETKDFDYSKSNQDKIAAWQTGDTVSIFIDHHHHGEMAHDSITAIKLGVKECSTESHNHEGHEHHDHANCEGHNHAH